MSSWSAASPSQEGRPTTDVDSRAPATTSEERAETSGMDQGAGVGQAGTAAGAALRKCNLAAQGPTDAQGGVPAGSREGADGPRQRTVGADLFQGLQEPDPGHRAGDRNSGFDARVGQVSGLLLGDDLCGFYGRGLSGRQQSGDSAAIHLPLLQVPAQPTAGGLSL